MRAANEAGAVVKRATARSPQRQARSSRQRNWRYVGWIAVGWGANYLMFGFQIVIFVVYGCRFQAIFAVTGEAASGEVASGEPGSGEAGSGAGVDPDEALFVSWAWSVVQRFLVQEPFIILFGFALPMLFATECCANLCTESCNNAIGVCVSVVAKSMKRAMKVS